MFIEHSAGLFERLLVITCVGLFYWHFVCVYRALFAKSPIYTHNFPVCYSYWSLFMHGMNRDLNTSLSVHEMKQVYIVCCLNTSLFIHGTKQVYIVCYLNRQLYNYSPE